MAWKNVYSEYTMCLHAQEISRLQLIKIFRSTFMYILLNIFCVGTYA
jgi:hypothetical protein